jgi:hypothetical protein
VWAFVTLIVLTALALPTAVAAAVSLVVLFAGYGFQRP